MYSQDTSLLLPIARARIFKILTEYALYRKWIPGVTRSRVLMSEGDITVVELRWPRVSEEDLVFELVQSPPVSVVFNEVGPGTLSGRWDLTELEGGRRTLVKSQLKAPAPFYRPAQRRLLRRLLEETTSALEQRARLGAGLVGVETTTRSKLLEITRRRGRLELWWQGDVFELPKKVKASGETPTRDGSTPEKDT
jgi:hypothetical protein